MGEESFVYDRKIFGSSDAKEAAQLPNAGGVAQLSEGLGLDLTDALAGDLELFSDLLKGPAGPIDEAEALLQNLALSSG